MPDPTLASRSPLDGVAKPGRNGRPDGPAGVTVAWRRDTAVAMITAAIAREADCREALRGLLGAEPPAGPKRVAADGFALIGAGPRQWLAIGEDAAGRAKVGTLGQSLAGIASVVDVGDGRVVLAVAGPQARAALAKGVPIDLHPRAFRPGDAATTTASHIGLTIWLIDETPAFGLAVNASYAGSFWSWLMASAAEYGCDVVG